MIPLIFSSDKTAVAPYILDEISSIAFLNFELILILGTLPRSIISLTDIVNLLPRDPEGCSLTKSLALKSFKFIKQIAIVSPIKS